MKKVLLLMLAIMLISAPVLATNVVKNGDFSLGTNYWTVWNQRNTFTFDTSAGDAWLKASNYNGGIYQTFDVVQGATYTISGWMKSDPYRASYMWAEVYIINSGTPGLVNGTDYNPGAGVHGLNIGCVKEDSYRTGAATWDESFASTHVWAKTLTFVAASTKATILLKAGNGGSAAVTGVRYDNIVVDGPAVPEPASILAMLTGLGGLGGLVIRRKR